MLTDLAKELATVLLGIIGVAVVAVLVSKNSQTPAVLQSAGSAFSNALDVAVSPVTGNTSPPNLSYPNQFNFGFAAG